MKGIDVPIEQLRSTFETYLWTTDDFIAYGRAYRNEREDGIVPEVLQSGSNEYIDVLENDNLDALVFFDVDPNRTEENDNQGATVFICFAVNLKKLYPLITERATEYAHEAARKLIKISQFDIVGLKTGLEAFSTFSFDHNDNMSPYYLFTFETNIININNC